MKFRVERDALADAVTWAARALPSRPPVPVLAGLLLEADPTGVLRLSSFDYEVSARVEIPADHARSLAQDLVKAADRADVPPSVSIDTVPDEAHRMSNRQGTA